MEIPKNLYLNESRIHGIGLFTKVAYDTGDVCFVGKYKTTLVENPDVPINFIDGHAIIPRIHCPQISKKEYQVYSFDSFMNHSNTANTTVTYIDDEHYFHTATRPIKANEELTVSYDEVYSQNYPNVFPHS